MNKPAVRTGLLFAGIWLLLVVGGRSNFFRDPGTFWHIAVGERLLQEGFFDKDPYTFTFAGQEWIPHQWFGELLMFMAYRAGGFDLLLVAVAGILAAVFTVPARRLMDIGLHPILVTLLLAIALSCASGHFHVRPHIGTITGFLIVPWILSCVERGRLSTSQLWWLAPVCWVWSNIHGGVLGGLATIGFVFAGWGTLGLFGTGPFQLRRDYLIAGQTMVGCLLVTLLNPYGWKLPVGWLEIYQMKSLPGIILEHRPLNFHTFGWQGVVGLAIVYIGSLLLVPFREWRVTYLVPVIWFVLALTRVRHAPLFAVPALISLADLFPQTRLASLLVRRQIDFYVPPAEPSRGIRLREWLVPAAGLLIAAIVAIRLAPTDRLHPAWVRLDPVEWPVESVSAIKQAADQYVRPAKIFCEYKYGGFLILFEPRCQVYIDDRCELFGDAFLEDFVRTGAALGERLILDPGEPLDRWQRQYGEFDMALVASGEGFDHAFASQPIVWMTECRDDTAVLYVRRLRLK